MADSKTVPSQHVAPKRQSVASLSKSKEHPNHRVNLANAAASKRNRPTSSIPPVAPRYDRYANFIKSIDPVNDDPFEKHFTQAWIEDRNGLWPENTDLFIWRHMLYSNYYFPPRGDMGRDSMTSLQKRLTRGTVLAECDSSSKNFKTFDERLYKRIHSLSRSLENKNIIRVKTFGKWSKTDSFEKVWNEHCNNRQNLWAKKPPRVNPGADQPERIEPEEDMQEPEQASGSVYQPSPSPPILDKDEYANVAISDSEDSLCGVLSSPEKSSTIRPKQPFPTLSKATSTKLINTGLPSETPGWKLGNDNVMFDKPGNKRQKTSHRRDNLSAQDGSNDVHLMFPSLPLESIDNQDQARRAYIPEIAKEARQAQTQNTAQESVPSSLTSPPVSPRCQSPPSQMMSQTSLTDTPPMTPISDPNDNETSGNDVENVPNSQSLAPLTPPANTESPVLKIATLAQEERRSVLPRLVTATNSKSDAIQTPINTPAPKMEVFLTFCSKDGRPNLRDFIPCSALKLSLGDFFNLYSERTNIPIEDLEFLTLYYPWAGYPHYQLVRRDGSEVEWRIAEDDIRRLYKKTRLEKPDIQDFEVWVQPGYDRSLTPNLDDMDLSRI